MVVDYGTIFCSMEEIAISKFKATCLALLEQVRKTGKPILVTRFGEPIAEIIPPPSSTAKSRRLGALRGSAEIVGDIVSPANDQEDWEVLR
jgi:prevent-host-death family protein